MPHQSHTCRPDQHPNCSAYASLELNVTAQDRSGFHRCGRAMQPMRAVKVPRKRVTTWQMALWLVCLFRTVRCCHYFHSCVVVERYWSHSHHCSGSSIVQRASESSSLQLHVSPRQPHPARIRKAVLCALLSCVDVRDADVHVGKGD